MNSGTRKKILSDHKRVGKKFIPLLAQLELQDVHWIDTVIPELIWLALLNAELGIRRGAQLTATITKLASKISRKKIKPWFALVSAFESLTNLQKTRMVVQLETTGDLNDIKKALSPLINLYPKCPIRFLYRLETDIDDYENEAEILKLKRTLGNIFDRKSVSATWCQANAIYAAFVCDKLKVSPELALANFPAVENYPNTEESRKIAASIRATTTMMVGQIAVENRIFWPRYFWNRGLELEDCEITYAEQSRN